MSNRGIIGNIEHNRGSFALAFFAMFIFTLAFLWATDTLPESDDVGIQGAIQTVESAFSQNSGALVEGEEEVQEAPVHVVARSIGLDAKVQNPTSTEIEALDQELLKGAVRYPTSAMLGQNGTVLLFGHSSYLPVVLNQAYKAFNKIQELQNGSIVSVYSGTTEYRYKVTGVRLAKAEEDVVELPTNGKYLTLVTCNSFATKSDRFVVTAEFVGAYALSN